MKAWIVRDKDGESGSMIVFAETRGRATSIALHQIDFDDYVWTDLRVNRFKEWDSHYKGNAVEDFWFDAESRVELVRDFGWSCIDYYWDRCKDCPANMYCYHWEAMNEGESAL